ncbi:MAG: Maf family protein [Tepidiformaceae bacterium]
MTTVVLASGSPRRRELLVALVDSFDVLPADVDETLGPDARADAMKLAVRKAEAVSQRFLDVVVIGSDTIVFDEERSFGKPVDDRDAVAMLGQLRGRAHRVVTGVAVAHAGAVDVGASETEVWLHELDYAQIVRYVASGRPLDKAGSYAIQDADVPTVDRIEGCYCCVMGLPLWRLRSMLQDCGIACRRPDETFQRCRSCPDRDVIATSQPATPAAGE